MNQEQPAVPAEPVTTESAPSTPAPAPATAAKKAKKPAPKGKAAKAKPAKAKKASGKSGASGGVTGPAVLRKYAPDYVKGGKDGSAKTAGGNKTIDNGDKLAVKLRGLDLPGLYSEAAKVLNTGLEEGEKQVTVSSLKAKYGSLNAGMQRMNLGNRMRAVLGLTKSGK